ncbi:MAG: hypothetical protein ACPLYE_01535 [Candidatus Micrarchaeales archaeon]|jgi:ssDNA-binding replication factor A large subunit
MEEVDAYSGMISRENIGKLNGNPKKVKVDDILNGKVQEGEVVDIEGNVYRIFNPRRFEKDGKERHVRTLILGDGEKSIRVALWDKASALADIMPIERGDKINASNLLLKKGLTELELSSRQNTFFTRVSISNTGIGDFSMLKIGDKDIDVLAKIVEIGSTKYFEDQNGKQRKVVRCVITDGLANMNAAFWDSSCDYIVSAHPGDFIKIEFCSIKDNNGMEVNAGNFSRIIVNKIFKSRLVGFKV